MLLIVCVGALVPWWVCCCGLLLQIRSIDYMQTKVKQPSSKAIYRLVGMDLFGTDTKAHHVSRIFQLPHTGVRSGVQGCAVRRYASSLKKVGWALQLLAPSTVVTFGGLHAYVTLTRLVTNV